MVANRWTRAFWPFAFLFVIGVAAIGHGEDSQEGLAMGKRVPISSMRCVVGEPNDRNTCLAGKYRQHRAFSVYVRAIDEPQLNSVLKKLDDLLQENQELRGYVVLLEGKQFDEALKRKLSDWAKEQKFEKLDLAIAIGASSYGIAAEASVVVVYSDKRDVQFHRAFAAGRLDSAAVEALTSKLGELSR